MQVNIAADSPGRGGPAGRGPAGHAPRPRPAARSAVVAASRTGRRAPAGPGRARPARRSSPAVAWCTGRRRATTTSARPKKMKAAALRGALSDRARARPGARGLRPHRRRHAVDQGVAATLASISSGQARPDRRPARRRVALEEPAQRAGVHCSSPDQLNTYDVLVSDDVVFTKDALEAFLAGPPRQVGQGARRVGRAGR